EQAAGREADHRTDIFSLGVVLFEMLCGKRPFSGASTLDTLQAILNAPVPSLARLNPVIPPEMDEILAKALARDPRERYCHARDFGPSLPRSGDSKKGADFAGPGSPRAPRPPPALNFFPLPRRCGTARPCRGRGALVVVETRGPASGSGAHSTDRRCWPDD